VPFELSASYAGSAPTACDSFATRAKCLVGRLIIGASLKKDTVAKYRALSDHLTAEALENGPTVNCRYICQDSCT